MHNEPNQQYQPYPQQPYLQQPYVQQAMPPPYAPTYPYPLQEKKHGGMAVAALVLGIIGLIFSCIPAIGWFVGFPCDVLAIIFGAIAWKGWGKAKAGVITGAIGIIIVVIWTVAIANAAHHAAKDLDAYNRCMQVATTPDQMTACDNKYLN